MGNGNDNSRLVRFGLSVVLILQLISCTMAGNILALMGLTSHSHHILNTVLLYELAERGHNLTILSVDMPLPYEKVPPNVTFIHLERAYDFLKGNTNINSFINIGAYESIRVNYAYGLKTAECIAASEGMKQLLAYPDDFKFDVIINDHTLGPYLLGFVPKFNYPPVIGISPFLNVPVILDFMSNSYYPALVPYFSTLYSANMSFLQRFDNTLLFIYDTLYRRLYYNPKIDKIMRPIYGDNIPHLSDLAKLTKIAFVNTHPATDPIEFLPPTIIQIGGMQGRPGKPLPADLDKFMRSGKRGAILFSLGTNILPQFVDTEIKLKIVEAFKQLPEYNFIWKFDEDYLKDVKMPSNVLVKKFVPQSDILAHKSLVLFVSHCGALSTQEATWHGVPLVGIPLFLDQSRNLIQAVDSGVAVKVDYKTLTTEALTSAIREVTENPSYSKAMKLRSQRLRDLPISTRNLAVWWVEYLMRHPDPAHLHSTAKELNYFQIHSLDVLAVIVFVPLLIIFALTCLCSGRRQSHTEKHRKRD